MNVIQNYDPDVMIEAQSWPGLQRSIRIITVTSSTKPRALVKLVWLPWLIRITSSVPWLIK